MKVELSASKIWRVILSPWCSTALSSTSLTLRSAMSRARAMARNRSAALTRLAVACSSSSRKRSSRGSRKRRIEANPMARVARIGRFGRFGMPKRRGETSIPVTPSSHPPRWVPARRRTRASPRRRGRLKRLRSHRRTRAWRRIFVAPMTEVFVSEYLTRSGRPGVPVRRRCGRVREVAFVEPPHEVTPDGDLNRRSRGRPTSATSAGVAFLDRRRRPEAPGAEVARIVFR